MIHTICLKLGCFVKPEEHIDHISSEKVPSFICQRKNKSQNTKLKGCVLTDQRRDTEKEENDSSDVRLCLKLLEIEGSPCF